VSDSSRITSVDIKASSGLLLAIVTLSLSIAVLSFSYSAINSNTAHIIQIKKQMEREQLKQEIIKEAKGE